MPDFAVVDAHVHFYDPARLSYPWLDGVPGIKGRHLPGDYAAATGTVAVEKLVFVEVDAEEHHRFDEARFVAGLAAGEPRIAGVVASALVERGRVVEEEIEALKAAAPLRGIRRQIQNRAEPGWCLQPGFIEGVRLLAEHGLPFDICIKNSQLTDATELVRRCPEVTFVLDHIAKPSIAAGEWSPWADDLRAIAALPNVVVKLAGVTTEADHGAWTFEAIRPYIDHAIACFGLDRCLFASDWPVMNLSDSFAGWVATLDRVLEGCSEAERRAFYRDNALRVYRL